MSAWPVARGGLILVALLLLTLITIRSFSVCPDGVVVALFVYLLGVLGLGYLGDVLVRNQRGEK